MDEKYDLRLYCMEIAFVKEELNNIIRTVKSSDIDWLETGEIVKVSAQRALEYIQRMLEVMAEDHPEFKKSP